MPDPERRMSVTWLIAAVPDNLPAPLDSVAGATFDGSVHPRSMRGAREIPQIFRPEGQIPVKVRS
jgi:hypothetical protein